MAELGKVVEHYMEERGVEDVPALAERMREATGYPFETEAVVLALHNSWEAHTVVLAGFKDALNLTAEEDDRMWDAFERDLGKFASPFAVPQPGGFAKISRSSATQTPHST